MKIIGQTLLKRAALKDVGQIYGISSGCNFKWSEDDFRSEIVRKNSLLLIAENQADKVISGFISVRFNKFEVLASESDAARDSGGENNENEMDIINLGVLPRYRRSGIGKMLFEKSLTVAAAENIGAVWLEVRASNSGAVEFYRRFGFVCVQVRKRFYAVPADDALVLKLNLSPA